MLNFPEEKITIVTFGSSILQYIPGNTSQSYIPGGSINKDNLVKLISCPTYAEATWYMVRLSKINLQY